MRVLFGCKITHFYSSLPKQRQQKARSHMYGGDILVATFKILGTVVS